VHSREAGRGEGEGSTAVHAAKKALLLFVFVPRLLLVTVTYPHFGWKTFAVY